MIIFTNAILGFCCFGFFFSLINSINPWLSKNSINYLSVDLKMKWCLKCICVLCFDSRQEKWLMLKSQWDSEQEKNFLASSLSLTKKGRYWHRFLQSFLCLIKFCVMTFFHLQICHLIFVTKRSTTSMMIPEKFNFS